MAKPEDDFGGYMEDLQQRALREEAYREQLERHEIWRQTTWGGFAVRQVQALGRHFSPFFDALVDLFQAEENSPQQLIFTTLIRTAIIAAYIIAAYTVLRIVNTMISREIVIEEEIIIDHDDDEPVIETAPQSRRAARDKKDR